MTKEEIAELKDAWNSLVGFCSLEDLPPKLSTKVKRAAVLLTKLEATASATCTRS